MSPTCTLAACLMFATLACTEPGQTEIARGNVLASQRKFDAALAAYDAAAKAAPKRARPHELRAHILFDLGRLADARRAYEQAVAVDAKDALEARIGLARLDAEEGKLDDALARMTEVLAEQPDNLYALLSRATLALRRGSPQDVERAISDTAEAMRIAPTAAAVLFTRGSSFLAGKELDQAAEAFRLLEREHPKSPLASYGQARIAAARGERDTALRLLRTAKDKADGAASGWKADEVRKDPAFQFLREDQDFLTLVGAS